MEISMNRANVLSSGNFASSCCYLTLQLLLLSGVMPWYFQSAMFRASCLYWSREPLVRHWRLEDIASTQINTPSLLLTAALRLPFKDYPFGIELSSCITFTIDLQPQLIHYWALNYSKDASEHDIYSIILYTTVKSLMENGEFIHFLTINRLASKHCVSFEEMRLYRM